MVRKILVAYASKYGSTREIAERIGEGLQAAGLQVDVLPASSVQDISQYEAIILGSAVYVGKWQKDAETFLRVNEKELATCPVWLFSSGPSGEGDPSELVEKMIVPPGLKPLIDRIQPRGITIFHGNIDHNKVNFIEKWAIKSLVKKPFGDYRDWKMIADWTETIAHGLKTSEYVN